MNSQVMVKVDRLECLACHRVNALQEGIGFATKGANRPVVVDVRLQEVDHHLVRLQDLLELAKQQLVSAE